MVCEFENSHTPRAKEQVGQDRTPRPCPCHFQTHAPQQKHQSIRPPLGIRREWPPNCRAIDKANKFQPPRGRPYSITSRPGRQAIVLTLNNCHFSSIPFRECSPALSNAISEPATRSFTVRDMTTSLAL